MKIVVRLVPVGEGRWRWLVGRAGVTSRSGQADSFDAAQAQAEDAAQEYAAEIVTAQSYMYDTDSHERIGFVHEEG